VRICSITVLTATVDPRPGQACARGDSGPASTCITVARKGQTGNYRATERGLLSSAGSPMSNVSTVKCSAHPSSSLFALPAGAGTVTVPAVPTVPGTP
jgi:hypothetical protein